MEGSTVQARKWSLSREGFEEFLAYLDPNRERAGQKYEQIRRTLITFFRCRGCLSPEESADETIDRVIRRMVDTRIEDVMSFTRGVARHVLAESHRSIREVPLLNEAPRLLGLELLQEEDGQDVDRRMGCLVASLRTLDADDRELILQWYRHDKSEKIRNRRKLAAARGVSAETLRVQVHRVRKQIHQLVQKCLKSSRVQ
jgi:hypothetical protein